MTNPFPLEITSKDFMLTSDVYAVINFFNFTGEFISEELKLPRLTLLDLQLPEIHDMEQTFANKDQGFPSE
jgi:hypothetical protein